MKTSRARDEAGTKAKQKNSIPHVEEMRRAPMLNKRIQYLTMLNKRIQYLTLKR